VSEQSEQGRERDIPLCTVAASKFTISPFALDMAPASASTGDAV
jgi:hypothetical protein